MVLPHVLPSYRRVAQGHAGPSLPRVVYGSLHIIGIEGILRIFIQLLTLGVSSPYE